MQLLLNPSLNILYMPFYKPISNNLKFHFLGLRIADLLLIGFRVKILHAQSAYATKNPDIWILLTKY